MFRKAFPKWIKDTVPPDKVMSRIEPGMSIFLGTGTAEPRTLVRQLMESDAYNLQDLELIQIVSIGDFISNKKLDTYKYRLKTFFSGWVANEAVTSGQIDLIPTRFSQIPMLFSSGQIPIDVAFIQITPPNSAGYCSLGTAVDVAMQAMQKASLVVGEINPYVPQTFGDTFIHIKEFDFLIQSTEKPFYFERPQVPEVFDKIAENVASIIEDGNCLAFSIGPLFDALAKKLVNRRHLGIHSPFMTDAVMELVKSGAVTNRQKDIFRGKSVASYAIGTQELSNWLHRNPLLEFQGIDKVFNPIQIGKNNRFIFVLTIRKIDLTGQLVLHFGTGNIVTGTSESIDFFNGAELSPGGRTVAAFPSRNKKGQSNILISVDEFPNHFPLKESLDMVATEFGVASLYGRTVRERALALIEIAHPDDREDLVAQAKARHMLYPDQLFIAESAHLYPSEVTTKHMFKNDVEIYFRAIRPSDEEEMRRLFYRFSDAAVYYRYFTAIKTMPHSKMQEYVNVDYREVLSIVGLVGEPEQRKIIAEARFSKHKKRPYADVAFIVDEKYQGLGIATFLLKMLVQNAKERGIKGFTADVLATNKSMLKVFEKGGLQLEAHLEQGVYEITIPFHD